MSALGELIVYILYGGIILFGLLLAYQAFVLDRKLAKCIAALGSLFCFALVALLRYNDLKDKRLMELEHAGTYFLTRYPNCDSCKAILNEDNSYKVVKKDSILEKGNWHFEMGGDYLIVYLNGTDDQLGGGRFEFDTFVDRNNKVY